MANTKDYSMREMIIDQCLSTGREFTREELQEAVNKGLQSRDMLPIKSKVTILQDINEMDEKFRRMYGTSGIIYEDRGRKRYYRYRDGIEMVKQGHSDGLTDEESLLWPNDHQQALRVRRVIPLFDKLGAEGVKGKMNSGLIIEFLKWCRVESKLEKRLYQYFCQAYKAQGGQLQTLGWSSICQVRKDRIERHISDEEQAESFERLLASIA